MNLFCDLPATLSICLCVCVCVCVCVCLIYFFLLRLDSMLPDMILQIKETVNFSMKEFGNMTSSKLSAFAVFRNDRGLL